MKTDVSITAPEESRNYYLFRSSMDLLSKNRVGHGWDIRFADFDNAQSIIEAIGGGIGRRANQIRRFKAIKEGDIIVVPVGGGIVIGRAKGVQHFEEDGPLNGKNQHEVAFTNEQGVLNVVPRGQLHEKFQRRLKIRASLTDLSELKSEIDNIFEKQCAGLAFDFRTEIAQRTASLTEQCKLLLLQNIRSGRTRLQGGGFGLEKLIAKLLEIEGFNPVKQFAKNIFPGCSADADLEAKKTVMLGSLLLSESKFLIQVKHHEGGTSGWGLHQLDLIKNTAKGRDEFAGHQLMLITSGEVSDDLYAKAEEKGILVMDGNDLVEWIWNSLPKLPPETKQDLGIAEVPHITGELNFQG